MTFHCFHLVKLVTSALIIYLFSNKEMLSKKPQKRNIGGFCLTSLMENLDWNLADYGKASIICSFCLCKMV